MKRKGCKDCAVRKGKDRALRVAVLFGCESVEHDISVITGLQTASAMSAICEVVRIYADKRGAWRLVPSCFEPRDLSSQSKADKLPEVALLAGGRIYKRRFSKYIPITEIDAVVLCFHGGWGENGGGAGLIESLKLPCINGSTALHSVAMDKVLTKLVAKSLDIPVLPHFTVKGEQLCNDDERERVAKKALETGYPLIVKPVHLGSSIGVSCVREAGELFEALDVALCFDETALVEPKLEDICDVNCACAKINGKTTATATERPLGKNEILDFADKYLSGDKKGARRTFPYDCIFNNEIKQATVRLYDALGGRGTVRVDFLVGKDKWYLNEINAIPGSMAAYLFEEELPVLMKKLLQEELERYDRESKLVHYIDTSAVLRESKGKLMKS